MKHLKFFEKVELSPEEKSWRKLANKLKFNLNKFFKNNNKTPKYPDKPWMGYTINVSVRKGNEKYYTIINFSGVASEWKTTNQYKLLINKIIKMGVDPFSLGGYFNVKLNKKQSEELIFSLRNDLMDGLIEMEGEKYNL